MTLDQFFEHNPEWRKYADLVAVPPTADEIRQEFPDADRDVLARPFDGTGMLSVGTIYVRVRREGGSDRWAAMCALQQAPRIMTDSVFFEGAKRLGDQFEPRYVREILTAAKRRGFTPNPTDVYQPGLARFKGDPEAFVPATGGRGYIQKLCARRGWACEGAVEVAHREPESDPHEQAIPLAEDLVRSNARRMIKQNPDLARLSRRELRQHVLAKHGAKK